MIFAWRDLSVYYELHGQGTPLVLLNGIMMSTVSWAPFTQAFQAGGHQVITVDLIDQGRSAASPQGYDMRQQADMVWALMDHLGHKSVNLLGTSYGGALALQMAANQPRRVTKMLLAATRCYTDPLFENMLESWLHARHSPQAFYTATMPLFYGATYQEEHRDWMRKRRALLERTLFQDEDFLARMGRLIRSIMVFDLRASLSSIASPTLVLAPEEDLVMMPWEQQRIARGIPGARLVTLPRTGHVLFQERPDLFTELVLGFFTHTTPIHMP